MNGRDDRQAARRAAEKPTNEDARQAAIEILADAKAARRHGKAWLEFSFHDGELQNLREQSDFARPRGQLTT